MTKALGPRAGITTGGNGAGWVVLIICWTIPCFFFVVWIAAHGAAAVSDGDVASFGWRFMEAAARLNGHTAWPGTPTGLVIGTTTLAFIAIGITGLRVSGRIATWFPDPDDPVAALADNPGLDVLKPDAVDQQARRLRKSLHRSEQHALPTDEIGLALGELRMPRGRKGPVLYANWEDTVVAFMAPRSGKTTSQAIPFVLSAPGPVIATSNKGDLWAATADLRASDTDEHVWLFDPQMITYQPQTWWVDLLYKLNTVEDAHRLAGHFVLTVDDGTKKDLWGPAAQDLLAALFLAASTSGQTLSEVAVWLDEPAVPTPVELLHRAGYKLMASSLRGTQNGAIETRDGIYQTARTAAKALRDERILRWVTPPGVDRKIPRFDPHEFVATRQALFLLTEDLSPATPLIAAITDTTMRAARKRAERGGGRLDPPLVVCLDEAANICKIADLPQLYSHLGSRGIVPVTILQTYEQGQTVWGERGMDALWGAATRKVIGAGVDSPRLARDLSTLVGQHDVAVRSITYGSGHASEQISLRRQEILEAADIRALAPGTALLLATGSRPALMTLRPWYTGPRRDEIAACAEEGRRKITEGAIEFERGHEKDRG